MMRHDRGAVLAPGLGRKLELLELSKNFRFSFVSINCITAVCSKHRQPASPSALQCTIVVSFRVLYFAQLHQSKAK